MKQRHPNNAARRVSLRVGILILLLTFSIGGYFGYRHFRTVQERNRAVSAAENRDFKRSLEHWERIAAEWDDSGETAFETARIARRAGDLRKADDYLKTAERLGWVAEAILLERSLIKVERGRLREEEGFLLACVRGGHPDTLLIVEAITPTYIGMFNIPVASELLEVWIEKDPARAQPWVEKGMMNKRLNRRSAAVEAFRKAVEVELTSVLARQMLAEIAVESNAFDEARPHLQWLIDQGKAEFTDRIRMARCLASTGEIDQALATVLELETAHGHRPEFLAEAGKLELSAGRPLDAEKRLRRAIEKMPYDRELNDAFGRCLQRNGKSAEAKVHLDRAKEVEDAQAKMDEFLAQAARDPIDPEPRFRMAEILMKFGQESAAVGWLNVALEKNPKHLPSLQLLVDYYQRTGQTSQARHYRQLIDRK